MNHTAHGRVPAHRLTLAVVAVVAVAAALLGLPVAPARATVVTSIDRIVGDADHASQATMSADGRWVAYVTQAALTVNGTTAGGDEIWLLDTTTGSRSVVAGLGVDDNGVPHTSTSEYPSLSADGRYLAFMSTSVYYPPVRGLDYGLNRIFVYDRISGGLQVVSTGLGGGDEDGGSAEPQISNDGRHVAFSSSADNLTADPTGGRLQAYERDLDTGRTVMVSRTPDGTAPTSSSGTPVPSADGRMVAFVSAATNLIPHDDNPNGTDIYVRDVVAGTTTVQSVDSTGAQFGRNLTLPSIDDAGSRLTFSVRDDAGHYLGIYLRDIAANTTTQIIDTGGTDGRISADGRFVAFASNINLIPADTNFAWDAYLWDSLSGSLVRITQSQDGGQFIDDPGHDGQGLFWGPVVDSGAHHVVFTSIEPWDENPFTPVPVDQGYPVLIFRSTVRTDVPPDPPLGVTATAGAASATVSWTAPAGDGGTPVLSYTATAAPGGASCTAAAPATSCTVNGLNGGTPYTFTVTATNAVGTSAASQPSAPVVIGQAPAFTSAASASTGMRAPFTFSVTTTGTPAAAITESGTLPAGITLTDNGDGTATLAGSAAAGTAGSYLITLTAANGVSASATQAFTLAVTSATSAPAITSDATDTETFGVPFSFTVRTTGYPAPKLTRTGTLPSGVTFTDNGDGSATLAGTPAKTAVGAYPLTITAKSSAGTATQSFTLTVTKAPVIKKIPNTTTHVGTTLQLPITVSGYTTPTITQTGALPAGLTFTDHGNGSAQISGVPSPGSGGAYQVTITAANTLGTATQTFTLKVNEASAITSPATAGATAGSAFSFPITSTGYPAPRVTVSGTLPAGVTYKTATDTLSGTPKTTARGTYPVTVTATNSTTTITQTLTITVS